MELVKKGKIRCLEPQAFAKANISVQGFTTRHDGLSRPPYNSLNLGTNTLDIPFNVEGNRSLLARAAGSSLENLLTVNQVHSSDILVIDAPNQEYSHFHKLECDGIITDRKGVIIGICVADCCPILLLDPEKHVVAALHAGWKGTAEGICRKGIQAMKDIFGSNPAAILAAIGPAIGPCCYEVDEPVKKGFLDNKAGWDAFATPKGEGKWALDISRANRMQLLQEGLQEANITTASHCVSCSPELFFSHRRDKGETGRQMGFIMLK